jgi:hypothetical protein
MRSPDWNPKAPEMPVDNKGNVLHYPASYHMKDGGGWVTWQMPWYAELILDGSTSGRSAKYLNLVDDDGKNYPMFVTDLVQGIQKGTLEVSGGKFKGWWTGSKRGANYGIKTVGLDEKDI